MTCVYLGLGANINPANALKAGMAELTSTFANVKHSPVYQTQAIHWDGLDFLNMVASFDCHLSLDALRHWINSTETRHGRTRSLSKTSSQQIDIKAPISHGLDMDILLFGDIINLQQNIPRSDIWQRAYVLKPLSDLTPKLICPTDTRTVSELWQTFPKAQRIEKVSIDNLIVKL